MRLVDADHLVSLVNDATILGDGFKQAFTSIVNGEPTIEPERKKGKWISCALSEHYKCDQCGHRALFWPDEEGELAEALTGYCPFCGADLTEDNDNA